MKSISKMLQLLHGSLKKLWTDNRERLQKKERIITVATIIQAHLYWKKLRLANPGSKGYNALEMKKRIAGMTLLITVAIIVSYLAVVGWLTGFLIGKYGGGKREGMRGRVRSVMIPVGRHKLHLHHWLICLALMVIAIVKGFYFFLPPEIFLSFMGGLAFQGVYCYSDWCRIIHRPSS